MIKQAATAKWFGGLKLGTGQVSTDSGALKRVPYNFNMRYGTETGTSPEELVAAAHATCYSMALSSELQKINFIADSIKVTARATLEDTPKNGWKITRINLEAEATVLGCDPVTFENAANKAKVNCPVSQLLKADIVLQARLINLSPEVFEHGPI